MLMMVMEKPIQLTMVNAVPRLSTGAFCATNVENRGESAITTHPQINRKMTNSAVELFNKNKGDARQQRQDKPNIMVASFFVPTRCESRPLTTQAMLPPAITRNDIRGTFKPASG